MEKSKEILEKEFNNLLNKSFILGFFSNILAKKAGTTINETDIFLEEKFNQNLLQKEFLLLCPYCLHEIETHVNIPKDIENCYCQKCSYELLDISTEDYKIRWRIVLKS